MAAMIAYLASALVFAGATILASSVFTTRRLIARLPPGPVRNHWHAILALTASFIIGYLTYAWLFWNTHAQVADLLVPVVFFLGACFVWLTAMLSLETAATLMLVSVLQQENLTDPLTGVFNRRHLDRRLREEVTRAQRHGLPLSVLLLDLDHFKKVNDVHGHQAGDAVLAAFANVVEHHLREPDILARYGGEEFMVIAPQTSRKGAIDLAERLRRGIEGNRFSLHDERRGAFELPLTCSIGVATLGDAADSAMMLVRRADENLYRAKGQGRNRVDAGEVASPMPASAHQVR